MTVLSVNVNKIALLRNSRGSNYPDLLYFVKKIIALGVKSITVHPRQDERHITRRDVYEITELLERSFPTVEFNIEGYPSDDFMRLVEAVRPAQCTLVPDAPDQLTSDHGWDAQVHRSLLVDALAQLKEQGIRSALFVDPNVSAVENVARVAPDRVELYTEAFARAHGGPAAEAIFAAYESAARRATELGLGLNGGHDLNLQNLKRFLEIPHILEVSIGHALIVESLEQGMENVIQRYLAITGE
ncbi:MAG: pyridoxine 5'-phosphate synthase [Pseudohongiellaceae bacterium]|nr:pyridoxine 5'-phosphate synthase [Pseudohongiellaceae bacterium]